MSIISLAIYLELPSEDNSKQLVWQYVHRPLQQLLEIKFTQVTSSEAFMALYAQAA